jgi:hypothetical protein
MGKYRGGKISNWGAGSYNACHSTHPLLTFMAGTKQISIAGGSASSGKGKTFDIEVALQYSSTEDARLYPWVKGAGILVPYTITDGCAPDDAETFKALIVWLVKQLRAGKTLHVGCIGGHGRTGVVLSALYAYMTKDADAITYVRANYCKKAVESAAQVAFLAKHFNIKPVPGSKQGGGYSKTSGKVPHYDEPYIPTGFGSEDWWVGSEDKNHPGIQGGTETVMSMRKIAASARQELTEGFMVRPHPIPAVIVGNNPVTALDETDIDKA